MTPSRDTEFERLSQALGHRFDGEILVGGNYVPAVAHAGEVHVSGQVPRVGGQLVGQGRVGRELDLAAAQQAARVSAMRALALAGRTAGGLDRIAQVLRMNVFVQCAEGFTQISEVADAASEVLYTVLGDAGRHARTSVGVFQLPKDAPVEIDLNAAVVPPLPGAADA